jgi:hypothetical protein
MPLKKLRDVAETASTKWAPRLAPDNLRQAVALTQLAYHLHPWRYPHGVRKYRSMEDANAARRQWERTGSFPR